ANGGGIAGVRGPPAEEATVGGVEGLQLLHLEPYLRPVALAAASTSLKTLGGYMPWSWGATAPSSYLMYCWI
ncbi:MAG: hypothetical protein QW086_11020, partial [Pyrobaculum sp.]